MEKACMSCIYFETCGDVERTEPCNGKVTEEEDKKRTEHFFKDLVGSCKGTQYRWEIFTNEMAELMGITLQEAAMWEQKIVRYGISERQNGGVVTNA